MPISSKLSRKLHEAIGEEAASEMVDWMHRVDTQRAELRELNDLNFARFDERLDRFDERLGRFEDRLVDLRREMDARFVQVDARFDRMEATIVGRLEAKIEQRTADLMKWSFVFWCGAVAAVAALAGVLR